MAEPVADHVSFPYPWPVPAVEQEVKLSRSVTQTNQRYRPMIFTESEPEPDKNDSVPETWESDPEMYSEAMESRIAVYDIVWKFDGNKAISVFRGSSIEIRHVLGNPGQRRLFKELGTRYRAYFYLGPYTAVFSCELALDGNTLSNFKLLGRNRKMKADYQDDSLSFFFQDGLKDRRGRMFLGFRFTDWGSKHMNAISGWAMFRDGVSRVALTKIEVQRLEKNERLQMELED